MNDTVKRLMALADEYMTQEREGVNGYEARQALQDELQKLFTPLSDEKKPHDQPCVLCGGTFELDSNGCTTFSRCAQCRHVPLFRNGVDVAALVRNSGIGETK